MSNGNGKNKSYESAVKRATGAGDEAGQEMTLMPQGVRAMIQKPSQDDINAMMADETLEFAPQVHQMEEGDMIVGILEGRGKGAEFTQRNPMTQQDETRHVDTWIVRNPSSGQRISILSSAQLDEKLPPFEGGEVRIYHGGQLKTRAGFKVNNYTVSGPKKADGSLRVFARKEPRVLDVPAAAAQPQLNAPGPQDGGEDAVA